MLNRARASIPAIKSRATTVFEEEIVEVEDVGDGVCVVVIAIVVVSTARIRILFREQLTYNLSYL